MDDFYIISNSKDELLNILDGIRIVCNELGMHLNERKTHIVKISSVYKWLQVKYSMTSTGHIIKRINPKRVNARRRRLKKYAIRLKEGKMDYEHIENSFRSWMGSFHSLMSRIQRENMIELYEKLFNKEIKIIKNKLYFYDRE